MNRKQLLQEVEDIVNYHHGIDTVDSSAGKPVVAGALFGSLCVIAIIAGIIYALLEATCGAS